MLYALFIALILSSGAMAQVTKKKTAPKGKAPAVTRNANSFVSEKGRFSIDLPESNSTFEDLVPSADDPNESGGKYMWDVSAGVISVDYSDNPDVVIKTKKDYADMQEGILGGVSTFGGKVSSKKIYMTGKHRGYQVAFTDPEKRSGFTRMVVAGNRKYTLFGLTRETSPASRAFILKALDSFKLTPQK